MSLFLLNLLLALLWSAASGSFTPWTFIVGYIIGDLVIQVARPALKPSTYYDRFVRTGWLIIFFVYELVKSCIIVAWDVLTPGSNAKPAIVAFPIRERTELGIMLLSNVISLTPGTLSVDVSDDNTIIYVHVMYNGDDLDRVHRELRKLEQAVKAAVEPEVSLWRPWNYPDIA